MIETREQYRFSIHQHTPRILCPATRSELRRAHFVAGIPKNQSQAANVQQHVVGAQTQIRWRQHHVGVTHRTDGGLKEGRGAGESPIHPSAMHVCDSDDTLGYKRHPFP